MSKGIVVRSPGLLNRSRRTEAGRFPQQQTVIDRLRAAGVTFGDNLVVPTIDEVAAIDALPVVLVADAFTGRAAA